MSDDKNASSADSSKRRKRRRRKAPGAEASNTGGQGSASTPPGNADEPGKSSAHPQEARSQEPRRRRGGKASGNRDRTAGDRGSAGSQRPAEQRSTRGPDEGGDKRRSARRPREGAAKSQDAGAPAIQSPPSPSPAAKPRQERAANDRQAALAISTTPASVRWGDDSEAPTKAIAKLAPDMPANAPMGDWDPTSAALAEEPGFAGELSARVCNVIGVRFVTAGRLYLYDGGEDSYHRGDLVVVEGERGERIGTVGAQGERQTPPRSLKRVLRRAKPEETSAAGDDPQEEYLATAKALAKQLALGIKVFRARVEQGRLAIYYSCEGKTDVRGLTRALSDAMPLPVELRHHGARDEAKLVGGIGSCGLELCCSTWLPAFVPVSIKNAKDQGLVLNPTKVSGQCGRLKCCLVYEQSQYAEMRKGLPKLGKRVITNDGIEGRVIEVDVLHQRFRVSTGRGESKVYHKGEVEPMFASQAQGHNQSETGRNRSKTDSASEDLAGDQAGSPADTKEE